jgi:hypothetical protein
MADALQVTVELTQFNCGICGGTYAINERYRRHKQEHSGFWHCPYCQGSWGYGKGEIDQVKEALEAERRRLQAALSRENEERAAKEKLARKLKRVHAGVCPECNRSFQNLAQHMKERHDQRQHKGVQRLQS